MQLVVTLTVNSLQKRPSKDGFFALLNKQLLDLPANATTPAPDSIPIFEG